MRRYFDEGGAVASDTSGIAALPTISNTAQSTFNTALQGAGTATVSQPAVQDFNVASSNTPYATASNTSLQASGFAPQAAITPEQYGLASLDTTPTPQMQQGLGSLNTPMYSRHEGMLFGDDFYDQYAQNKGGQFVDPYHNFLMTRARVVGPDADINRLYQQYQASGRTDTPDWATIDTTGPISTLPVLASRWDASGAMPVNQLSSAWSSSTPLAEGVTTPEGYWDARLAYNMNLSKGHPDLYKSEDYTSGRVREINDPAYYALSQSIYDINDPRIAQYMNQRATSGMGDRPIW